MPYSYNGWYASPSLRTRPLVVAGESFSPGVLDNDDVYAVFRALAEFLHEHVEPIVRDDWHQADDWGYYYRPTTGGTSLSCHASATAVDYNATRHPYGVRGTWTAEQVRKVDAYLRDVLDGAVRWGEHYQSNVDGMHFEINDNPTAVARVAAKLRTPEDFMATDKAEQLLERIIAQGEASKRRDVHLRNKIIKPRVEALPDMLEDASAKRRVTASKNEILAAIEALAELDQDDVEAEA